MGKRKRRRLPKVGWPLPRREKPSVLKIDEQLVAKVSNMFEQDREHVDFDYTCSWCQGGPFNINDKAASAYGACPRSPTKFHDIKRVLRRD